jgi:hypothetical protein
VASYSPVLLPGEELVTSREQGNSCRITWKYNKIATIPLSFKRFVLHLNFKYSSHKKIISFEQVMQFPSIFLAFVMLLDVILS